MHESRVPAFLEAKWVGQSPSTGLSLSSYDDDDDNDAPPPPPRPIYLGEFHSSWRKITRSFFFFYFLFRKAFSSKGKLIERGNWAKKQATWVLYSRRRAILDAIVSRATSIVQRDGSALCYIDGILSILSHRLSAGRVAWWKKSTGQSAGV